MDDIRNDYSQRHSNSTVTDDKNSKEYKWNWNTANKSIREFIQTK